MTDNLMVQALKLLDTESNSPSRVWYPIFPLSIDPHGHTPGCNSFHLAAMTRNDVLLSLLLKGAKQGADEKDERGWTPLMRASQLGYLKVVKILPEAASKVTTNAVQNSALGSHNDVVERLVEKEVEVTTGAVEWAAWGGHMDIIE